MNDFYTAVQKQLKTIQEKKPILHHITNYVTMQDCANLCVAIGACPVMASYIEEVEEIVFQSHGLVLNMGTPDLGRIKAMIRAGKKANACNIPVIFDPVGAGASTFRKQSSTEILNEVHCSVIKGNGAELKALAGIGLSEKRGVDSVEPLDTLLKNSMKELAKKWNCVIAVTGEQDSITDGTRFCTIDRGSRLLGAVSGAGCMGATVTAAFCSIEKDFFRAAAGALFSVAYGAELAEKALLDKEGSAMFKVRFFDALSMLYNSEKIEKGGVCFV